MCGPSHSEERLQGKSESFASMLQANYGLLFGAQKGVLDAINRSLSPTLAAGPSQQGFAAPQLAAMQTGAINAAGAAARAARQAVANFGAGRGSSSGLESGVQKQLEASVASSSANQLATAENRITQANYEQGNANYWRAQGGMEALAQGYSPNAAETGAISENQAAFSQAHEINEERNQMAQTIAGGLTGLAGKALSFATGGIANLGAGESFGEGVGDFFKGGFGNLG
jgi:hypothetical protein